MPANIYHGTLNEQPELVPFVASSLTMWHKLVKMQAASMTIDQLTANAHIDEIKYITKPLEVAGFVDDESIAVCEINSKKVIGTFSNKYNCAPVSELKRRTEEIREALGLREDVYVAGGVLGGTKPNGIWLQFEVSESKLFGLDIKNYVMVSNWWNGKEGFVLNNANTAVICQNTYNAAVLRGINARTRNTQSRDTRLDQQLSENMGSIAEAIAIYRAKQEKTMEIFTAWGQKTASSADIEEFISFLAPNRARKTEELSPATKETRDQLHYALTDSPGIRDVPRDSWLWLWQGGTYYLSNLLKEREGQDRAYNDLFGIGQNVRDEMFSHILKKM